MTRINIALAQFAPSLADIAANLATIRQLRAQAAAAGADLLVLPELALTGPGPFERLPGFVQAALLAESARALAELQADSAAGGPALLVGLPHAEPGQARPFSALALLHRGELLGWRARVAGDGRDAWFIPGPVPGPIGFPVEGQPPIRLGVLSGQDLAGPDIAEALAESGAEILVAPSALPFATGGFDRRLQQAVHRVTETGLPLVQVNLLGGRGRQVFEGMSFALDDARRLAALAPGFVQDLTVTRWERPDDAPLASVEAARRTPPLDEMAALHQALVLALSDRLQGSGQAGVVVDLDEGPAAPLAAALAVDALGAARVRALASSREAAALATVLGIAADPLALDAALPPFLEGLPARQVAGLAAQALARRTGALHLCGLDRTSLALGAAGPAESFALLGDLDLGSVRALASWRNARPGGPALPPTSLEPLPGEAATEAILHGLLDLQLDPAALEARGFEAARVAEIQERLVRLAARRRCRPLVVRVRPPVPD
ncbi:nitrilase-related carbon-nitrogen hydrolase [Geminicoccus roseus]|uniref:nitrilase-related carbon-nitrogen hydrolase n=1 Tax=Geminicoccus roseus TaxID=404900 RepID=UPI000426F20A|nr:nitrilase-related carbon-nitrogen hydrolase [Geminicoccus roseus]